MASKFDAAATFRSKPGVPKNQIQRLPPGGQNAKPQRSLVSPAGRTNALQNVLPGSRVRLLHQRGGSALSPPGIGVHPVQLMKQATREKSLALGKQPVVVANGGPQSNVRDVVMRKNIPAATNARLLNQTRIGARSPVCQAQRFTSRVVQATKIYPNLHPGAVEPIDPSSVFRLNSFANQYRLHRVNSHSVNVPNQQYNFVRTREGEMLLHSRYRHPSIAEGKQVLYAGEIFFNNGQLEWWSNGSGHYQPYVEDAEQASLPMDQFFSYQQIIKGEHKRKKG